MNEDEFVVSSGNVFADLNVPDPELALLKSRVSILIAQVMRHFNIPNEAAAFMSGFVPEAIEDIKRGRLRDVPLYELTMILSDITQQGED